MGIRKQLKKLEDRVSTAERQLVIQASCVEHGHAFETKEIDYQKHDVWTREPLPKPCYRVNKVCGRCGYKTTDIHEQGTKAFDKLWAARKVIPAQTI